MAEAKYEVRRRGKIIRPRTTTTDPVVETWGAWEWWVTAKDHRLASAIRGWLHRDYAGNQEFAVFHEVEMIEDAGGRPVKTSR
jgi:hypothetical protein